MMFVKMPEGRGSPQAALKLMRAAALALLLAAPMGCQDKGPAEEAGEKIDRAAEKAADKIEDAADKVEEKVEDATKP